MGLRVASKFAGVHIELRNKLVVVSHFKISSAVLTVTGLDFSFFLSDLLENSERKLFRSRAMEHDKRYDT